MKLLKKIGILMVVVLALLTFAQVAFAEDFQVSYVKVEGKVMFSGDTYPVMVEKDSTIAVEVFFNGHADGNVAYDTKIKAWIGGYEYGDIEDVTPIFQVIPGVQDSKVLHLDIPADLESSEEYTLHVEMYDDDQKVSRDFKLRVEEIRHEINIYDTTFNPGKIVKAGQPLFVSVRLENLGDNAEDNIKVIAEIPGVYKAEEYMDELATWDSDGDDQDDAASSSDLLLMIPAGTLSGEYSLDVTVEYDRGHKTALKSYKINIVDGANANVPSVETLVNVDATSKAVQAGEGTAFKVSIANMGNSVANYNFVVKGTEGWGTYSVDPAALMVAVDATADANIFVGVDSDATDGVKTFSVDVMNNGEVVDTLTFNLEVENEGRKASATSVLLIIFIALLAVLVLLGIVLAIKKIASKGDEDNVEGQTYY